MLFHIMALPWERGCSGISLTMTQLDERLKREGTKTHKERVEELNRYLSNLSEHHDMYVHSPFRQRVVFRLNTDADMLRCLGLELDLDKRLVAGTAENMFQGQLRFLLQYLSN